MEEAVRASGDEPSGRRVRPPASTCRGRHLNPRSGSSTSTRTVFEASRPSGKPSEGFNRYHCLIDYQANGVLNVPAYGERRCICPARDVSPRFAVPSRLC